MDKTNLIAYLLNRRDLYVSLAKQANDNYNDKLVFAYMMVADELDRQIFVINLQDEEEK